MATMDLNELEAAVEAIVFASGEPVRLERICLALDLDAETAEQLLRKLEDHYAYERRGVRLVRMEDSFQLCSAPEYGDVVRKAFEIRKSAKLSQPALEVLTIIAYYQPTTKAFVEKLRGVDSSYSVAALLNKKLIAEDGRLDAPGRPILYRTTPDFLRTFGLESLEELPEMEKVSFSAPAEEELEAAAGQQTTDSAPPADGASETRGERPPDEGDAS